MPSISVIVPVYNGARHIEACLSAILSQDYPSGRMEIFVVDGGSTDGTREIVNRIAEDGARITLLDNPKKVTPCAFNLGLAHAHFELIGLVSGHTVIEPSYFKEAVRILNTSGASVVGGAMRPLGRNYVSHGLSCSHTCCLGLGGGLFHNVSFEGYVDTVYMGVYRKEIFDEIGNFDESIVRGQDHELNCRIRRAGGKIYMSPEIRSHYYCRDNLRSLARQMFRTGMWNVKKVQRNPDAFALRHWVPFGFVTTLIALGLLSLLWGPFLYAGGGVLALYLMVNLSVSALLAIRKGLRYLPLLPVVFATMHFCYGFGGIFGLFRFGFPVRALLKGFCRSLAKPAKAL